MKPIDPTIPSSASFPLPPLPDKITQLFQKVAPSWNQTQSSLGYDRLAVIVFAFSAIAYLFYSIIYPTKVEPPKDEPVDPLLSMPLETLLKDSILALKTLQDQQQLPEMNNPQSVFACHWKAILQTYKNDQDMRIAFGNILRKNSLENLSMDDLCLLHKALQTAHHPTSLLVDELLWKKMGDSKVEPRKNHLPHPLFYAESVQKMIDGKNLICGIPDPEEDPFFWALVLQSAPHHPKTSEWKSKIQTLLASPEDPMNFLGALKEDYKLRVQGLEAQNFAESGWAKHRLEAYRYLASVQKT